MKTTGPEIAATVTAGAVRCSALLGVPFDSWETGRPKHWGTYKFAVMQWNEGIVTVRLVTARPAVQNCGTTDCEFRERDWDEFALAAQNLKFIGPLDEEEYWLMKWTLDDFGGCISVRVAMSPNDPKLSEPAENVATPNAAISSAPRGRVRSTKDPARSGAGGLNLFLK